MTDQTPAVPTAGKADHAHHLVFLEAAGQGCISGWVHDWKQLKPACEWAAATIKTLSADRERLQAALEQSAAWFREYMGIHLAKGDALKAQRNESRAHYCEEALRSPAASPKEG